MTRVKCLVQNVFGFLLIGAIMLSVGCTHIYVPKESKYSTDKIPVYTCSSTVEFKNGQADTTEILFAENMGHDFLADLHDWTDVAIEIADRELQERGSHTAAKAGSVLTLKVTKASTTTGGWGFRGDVTLEVQTGSGLTKTFRGTAPAGNLYNATSGALAHAVTLALSDKDIMAYL